MGIGDAWCVLDGLRIWQLWFRVAGEDDHGPIDEILRVQLLLVILAVAVAHNNTI